MQDEELALFHTSLSILLLIETHQSLLNPYLVFDFYDYVNNTWRVLIWLFLYKYDFILLLLE